MFESTVQSCCTYSQAVHFIGLFGPLCVVQLHMRMFSHPLFRRVQAVVDHQRVNHLALLVQIQCAGFNVYSMFLPSNPFFNVDSSIFCYLGGILMTSALRLKKGSTIVCLWQLAVSTVPLANYCLTLAQSSHLCRIKVLT